MPAARTAWTHEELLIVFRLYCRTPFGRLHQRNPEIVQLAELIGRTPGAVAMKACNFASLDPQQQARRIKALGNVSNADRELWISFLDDSENIAQQAEAAYSTMTGKEVEDYLPELDDAEVKKVDQLTVKKRGLAGELKLPAGMDALKIPVGATEKEVLINSRRVQSFFRAAVLTAYEHHCAITGLAIPELLIASHIIPWSVDEKRRADPRNGLCLNALHDRAFDRGLISFDADLRLLVSPSIGQYAESSLQRDHLTALAGLSLHLPARFHPDASALEYHRREIFKE